MTETIVPSVESILDAVIDAIIVIDEAGIIHFVNPAVEKLFGYASQELLGKNISRLMPDAYGRNHDEHLHNYLRTGQAKVIGIGREIVAKKKDGTVFPVHLGVSEGRKEGGQYFFTGVIRDMSEVKHYHDELKKQSDFVSTILDTVQSLVIVLDRHGRVVNFNSACESATGYTLWEVVGKPFWDIFLPPEEKNAVTQYFYSLTKHSSSFPTSFENHWVTKRGEKRLFSWSNAAILDKDGFAEYVIGTGIDITEHRQLERMVLEITKKEQRRLGQELHDSLAQRLTVAAISGKLLEKKLSRVSKSAAKDAGRVVEMLNQAVRETRELAHGLYSLEMHSEDLISSLRKLAMDTTKMLNVRCVFKCGHGAIRISNGTVADHLYRIAREAVNNAVRHGRGKNIWIYIGKKSDAEAELRIENDGVRFLKSRIKSNGMGLDMMRSRAAVMNASVKITARLKGGAVVSCLFPLAR